MGTSQLLCVNGYLIAEQGYVNAQQNLGEIYYNAQDYKEAGSGG